jgi:hypothetical protein
MTKNDQFTQIARKHLGIETLEARNMDSLDFHDVGVGGLTRALDAAYRAGQAELLAAAEALLAAKDSQMVTIVEWRALRRAAKKARKNA